MLWQNLKVSVKGGRCNHLLVLMIVRSRFWGSQILAFLGEFSTPNQLLAESRASWNLQPSKSLSSKLLSVFHPHFSNRLTLKLNFRSWVFYFVKCTTPFVKHQMENMKWPYNHKRRKILVKIHRGSGRNQEINCTLDSRASVALLERLRLNANL